MKERGGCERGDVGGRGRGSSSARRGRGANSRPCFTNCHLKGTNRGTAAAREGLDCAGMLLTLPPLRHGCAGQRTKNKRNQFQHRRGFKQMRCDGNIEGSAADRHVLEISPVLVVYLVSNPCVCRKNKKTTLQDVVYIKVLV